jgi:hypothetical protein
MRTITFKISDLDSYIMETIILKKLRSMDNFFEFALNRDTQEVSIDSRSFQRMTDCHVDRDVSWDMGHPLINPKH